MSVSAEGDAFSEIDRRVEAFEATRAVRPDADLEAFAPAPGQPFRLPVLCELVRVDLELAHRRGLSLDLDTYVSRFPELFEDESCAQAIRFEQDRLRRQPVKSSINAAEFPSLSVEPQAQASCRGMPGGDGAQSLNWPPRWDDTDSSFEDLFASDPDAARRLATAIDDLPRAGSQFLGFHLERELGQGAFGRVFLARQGDLASRAVALKVTADLGFEAQTLAQLQHTNIVPIYSVHSAGPLRAVCMPFLGSLTLADVLAQVRREGSIPDSGAALVSSLASSTRPNESPSPTLVSTQAAPALGQPTFQVEALGRMGYVTAILWLGRRIADGLAHAHDRGILHRDLKPANVLLSLDGEPVLLDFNLAADTKQPAALARLGGTLPYMAPEHLEAFLDAQRVVDSRADLYALGVVLFELLTGSHPFPVRRGPTLELVPQMLDDRRAGAPSVRSSNPSVPRAVDAIIGRCLQPDPARRYASARELAEDLQCQLDDLPLRHTPEPSTRERLAKWSRRHPRLTSTSAAAALLLTIASVVGLASLAHWQRHRQLVARESLRDLETNLDRVRILLGFADAPSDQLTEGIDLARAAAARLQVSDEDRGLAAATADLPSTERLRMRSTLGDLLFLWGRAERWLGIRDSDPSVRRDRWARAGSLLARSEASFGPEMRPRVVVRERAQLARDRGDLSEAARLDSLASQLPVRSASDRLSLISDQLDPQLDTTAIDYIRHAAESNPRDPFAWLLLGDRYARLGQFDDARDVYGLGINLRPEEHWAYFLRGAMELDRGHHQNALVDFDRVLELRPNLTLAHVNRALARIGLGEYSEALIDLDIALARTDAPTRTWFIRAEVRDRLGDAEGAAADRAEGLRRQPSDELGWIARGLARLPSDPTAALADFDAALRLNPTSKPALQNRASVLSELLDRRDDAIAALDRLLEAHPRSVQALAGRGVLLARRGAWDAARRDAEAALKIDTTAATLYQVAGIYARAAANDPADQATAIRLLSRALRADPSWARIIPVDPELTTLRELPEIQAMLQAARVLSNGDS